MKCGNLLQQGTSGKLSPSMRREWIEMLSRHGTPGRKQTSPSMRREWIEIKMFLFAPWKKFVSLHAEGVD